MPGYVFGSSISYNDYLQAKSFSDEINSNVSQLSVQMPQSILPLIGRLDDLQSTGNELNAGRKQTNEILSKGFDAVSNGLERIELDLDKIYNVLGVGFSQVVFSLEHIDFTLYEIKNILQKTVETPAYNHYRIALDAYERQRYDLALDELDKAINGVYGVSAGYRLEWRFHHMIGQIKLGFEGCSIDLIDLPAAEAAFIDAYKVAEVKQPLDAAKILLCAWKAAYVQGKFSVAEEYLKQSIQKDNTSIEAQFYLSKTYMAQGKIVIAFKLLKTVLEMNPNYALLVASDGDFQRFNCEIEEFFQSHLRDVYSSFRNRVKQLETEYEHVLQDVVKLLQTVIIDETYRSIVDTHFRIDKAGNWLREFEKYHRGIEVFTSNVKRILSEFYSMTGSNNNCKEIEIINAALSKSDSESIMGLASVCWEVKKFLLNSLEDYHKRIRKPWDNERDKVYDHFLYDMFEDNPIGGFIGAEALLAMSGGFIGLVAGIISLISGSHFLSGFQITAFIVVFPGTLYLVWLLITSLRIDKFHKCIPFKRLSSMKEEIDKITIPSPPNSFSCYIIA